MHVLGELQIRHSDDRAPVEKAFVALYSIVDVVQLTSLLIFAAQLTRAFPNTYMDTEFWSPSDYALSLLLKFKTTNCSATVSASEASGFSDLDTTVTSGNAATLFAIHTERLRVAFAVCAIGFVVSALNRVLQRQNVFFVALFGAKLRLHKDIVTVVDVTLEIAGLVLTQACLPTALMLQRYLQACGVRSEDSVPFIPLAGLFVSSGCAVVAHVLSLVAAIVCSTVMDRRVERTRAAALAGAPTAAASQQQQQQQQSQQQQEPPVAVAPDARQGVTPRGRW
jgi:hypothetical protein